MFTTQRAQVFNVYRTASRSFQGLLHSEQKSSMRFTVSRSLQCLRHNEQKSYYLPHSEKEASVFDPERAGNFSVKQETSVFALQQAVLAQLCVLHIARPLIYINRHRPGVSQTYDRPARYAGGGG